MEWFELYDININGEHESHHMGSSGWCTFFFIVYLLILDDSFIVS